MGSATDSRAIEFVTFNYAGCRVSGELRTTPRKNRDPVRRLLKPIDNGRYGRIYYTMYKALSTIEHEYFAEIYELEVP